MKKLREASFVELMLSVLIFSVLLLVITIMILMINASQAVTCQEGNTLDCNCKNNYGIAHSYSDIGGEPICFDTSTHEIKPYIDIKIHD